MIPSDSNVGGVVKMMLVAIRNYTKILTEERLLGLHSYLFPTERIGLLLFIHLIIEMTESRGQSSTCIWPRAELSGQRF